MNGRGESACASAEITIAARTGSGMDAIQVLAVSTATATASAATIAPSLLIVPACALALPIEKPAPTGRPRSSPDARLAKPRAAISRLGDTGSPRAAASERMVAQLSARITTATGAANCASLAQSLGSRFGTCGRPGAKAIVPTTAILKCDVGPNLIA